jgi:hypothetical protein
MRQGESMDIRDIKRDDIDRLAETAWKCADMFPQYHFIDWPKSDYVEPPKADGRGAGPSPGRKGPTWLEKRQSRKKAKEYKERRERMKEQAAAAVFAALIQGYIQGHIETDV